MDHRHRDKKSCQCLWRFSCAASIKDHRFVAHLPGRFQVIVSWHLPALLSRTIVSVAPSRTLQIDRILCMYVGMYGMYECWIDDRGCALPRLTVHHLGQILWRHTTTAGDTRTYKTIATHLQATFSPDLFISGMRCSPDDQHGMCPRSRALCIFPYSSSYHHDDHLGGSAQSSIGRLSIAKVS
jgi:hypothetical protein